jgi:hypothetical protein
MQQLLKEYIEQVLHEAKVKSTARGLKNILKSILGKPHSRSTKFRNVDIVSNLTPEYEGDDVYAFVTAVGVIAQNFNKHTPTITSMKRTTKSQAAEMIRMFNNDPDQFHTNYMIPGAQVPEGGEKTGIMVSDYLQKSGPGSDVDVVADMLMNNTPISYHLTGRAIDFRVTPDIKNILHGAQEISGVDVIIHDESSSSTPHWHVSFR